MIPSNERAALSVYRTQLSGRPALTPEVERDLANRERSPADVMLGDVSLGRAVAGPLTAHLVGWTSAFDPSFEAALPPGAWEARGR